MPVLSIEYLTDEHDCETCGFNWAQGAQVTLDGEDFLMLKPVAHCYNDVSYEDSDILIQILEKLGYTVNLGGR